MIGKCNVAKAAPFNTGFCQFLCSDGLYLAEIGMDFVLFGGLAVPVSLKPIMLGVENKSSSLASVCVRN